MTKRTRKPAQGDDMKERIITFLDKAQRTKSVWFSQNEIGEGVRASQRDVKNALTDMTSEGWFHIRHEPGVSDRLLYRLKRSGDE